MSHYDHRREPRHFPLHIVAEEPWMAEGACRGKDPDLFFPGQHDYSMMAAAKAICAGCPVREPCQEYGLREPAGVWGGLSTRERKALRSRRRRAS